MRTLTLVGVIKNHKLIKVAMRCEWCRRFLSVADYLAAHKDGATVKGTICPGCAVKYEAGQMAALDALDSPTEAA